MKKWKKNIISAQAVRKINEKYNIDLLTATILARRNVLSPEEIKFYVEKDISFLHSPFFFEDMECFCDRILEAINQKEKICVFGDRDVDGITSTTLLIEELNRLGLETIYSLPEGNDPYGITKEGLDKAKQEGVTLAITVDCGISCFEEIDYANSIGIDTLVTDHHLSGELLPPAFAIIDPKVEGSGYPFKHLAGCGVVAKCILALRLANTNFYKQEFILLHANPGKETIQIEASLIYNLQETDRIAEEIVPGALPPENSRIMKFLSQDLPIMVLDADEEKEQLQKAFGRTAEINLIGLRNEMEKFLPQIKKKSLFSLSQISRSGKYSEFRSEIDTLVGLFKAYVRASNPLLYKEYIPIMDLVAIGTISDLMPLIDENRILVKTGLNVLEKTKRVGLIPYLNLQNVVNKHITTKDIGWKLAPPINSSGRLGCPTIGCKMLLSKTMEEAEENAKELLSLNRKRKKLSEDYWDKLLPKARKSYETFGTKMVLVSDKELPRGLTGNLANRFLQTFKAPAMVISGGTQDNLTGSMRSSKEINCHNFLSRYTDLFSDFGGHSCAAGFSIPPQKLDELFVRISEDLEYLDCPNGDNQSQLDIDAIIPCDLLTPQLINIVEFFEPFGELNNPLQFEIDDAIIEKIFICKNSADNSNANLKLTISYGKFRWPAIFFNASNRIGSDFDENESVDVVFNLGRNYYQNRETLQLNILDIKRNKE